MLSWYDKDVGVAVDFTVRALDGTLMNLTNFTGNLIAFGNPSSPLALTFPDPTHGVCRYTTAAGQWPVGEYLSQLRLSIGSSTFNSAPFSIRIDRAL
jgi:hypothetical protein